MYCALMTRRDEAIGLPRCKRRCHSVLPLIDAKHLLLSTTSSEDFVESGGGLAWILVE